MSRRSGQRSCAAGPRYAVKRRGIRRQAATWRIASWRSWRASSSGARRNRSIGLTPPLAPTSAASVRAPAPAPPAPPTPPSLPQLTRFARHHRGPDQPRGAGIDLGSLDEQFRDLGRHRGAVRNSASVRGTVAPIPLHWRSRRRRRSLQARPFSSRGGRNIASLAACRVTPPGGFLLSPPPSSPGCAGSSARPARREQIVAGPARGYTEAARSITARGAPVENPRPRRAGSPRRRVVLGGGDKRKPPGGVTRQAAK